MRSLPHSLPVLEGICSRMSFTLGASFLEEHLRKGPVRGPLTGIQLYPLPPDPQHRGLALAAPAPCGPHLPVATMLDSLGSCNSLGTPCSRAATSERHVRARGAPVLTIGKLCLVSERRCQGFNCALRTLPQICWSPNSQYLQNGILVGNRVTAGVII